MACYQLLKVLVSTSKELLNDDTYIQSQTVRISHLARRSNDAPDAVVSCRDPSAPASCECRRQCARLDCGMLNFNTSECNNRHAQPDTPCWHWPDRPPHAQLSDPPSANDASVVYLSTWRLDDQGKALGKPIPRTEFKGLVGKAGQTVWVPLARCQQHCSFRGRCAAVLGDTPEQTKLLCRWA